MCCRRETKREEEKKEKEKENVSDGEGRSSRRRSRRDSRDIRVTSKEEEVREDNWVVGSSVAVPLGEEERILVVAVADTSRSHFVGVTLG